MPQVHEPEFKRKLVRLHLEEGRSYKSLTRLGVNTISSKNLEGFCSQAQIWFTARNAPVKTSKVFVHYFFLSPVCEIYTMPPVEYYVVNRKTGMVGFGPTTY